MLQEMHGISGWDARAGIPGSTIVQPARVGASAAARVLSALSADDRGAAPGAGPVDLTDQLRL